MKSATFRRVPAPTPIEGPDSQVGSVIKHGSKTFVVVPRKKPAKKDPELRRVKKLERVNWQKDAKKRIANGQRFDRSGISNQDLLRLLATIDGLEATVRELTAFRPRGE